MNVCRILFILIIFKSNCLFSQDSLGYYEGVASYYDFHGRGNCSFKPPTKPVYTAAVNTKQYNFASLCGACLQVIGTKDTVIVRVEDRCPGCKFGGIDLSRAAFAKIDEIAKGRITVRWKVVPCPISQNIQLYIAKRKGTSAASFIVLNHKTPLKTVSAFRDSIWIPLDRGNHNYYTLLRRGKEYHTLRLIDWYGNEIITDSVQLTHGTYIDIKQQFQK